MLSPKMESVTYHVSQFGGRGLVKLPVISTIVILYMVDSMRYIVDSGGKGPKFCLYKIRFIILLRSHEIRMLWDFSFLSQKWVP